MIRSGYAYEKAAGAFWPTCPDDDWEIVVTDADPEAIYRGTRRIDGALCNVFLCADGRVRAQTK